MQPPPLHWLIALTLLSLLYLLLTVQAIFAVNTFWSRRGEFGFVGRKKFLTWFVVCGLLGWMFTRCVQAWLVGFAVYENTRKINLEMVIYESNAFFNVLFISVSGSFLALRVWLTYYDCCLAAANSESQWQNLIIQPVAYIPTVLARVNVELIPPERNTLGSHTTAMDTTTTSSGLSKILRHLSLTGGSRGSHPGHKHSISASLNPFTPSSGGGNSQCSVHAAFSPQSMKVNHAASTSRKGSTIGPHIKGKSYGFAAASSSHGNTTTAAVGNNRGGLSAAKSAAKGSSKKKVISSTVRKGHETVHSEDMDQYINTVDQDWFFLNRYTWGNHQWFYRKLLLFLLIHTLFVSGTFMVPSLPELSLIGLSIYVVEGSIFTLFIGKLASEFPRFNDSLKMVSELHLLFILTLVSTILMLFSIVFILAMAGQSWNLHRRINKPLEKRPLLFLCFIYIMNLVFIILAYLCIQVQTLWVCLTFPNVHSKSNGGQVWKQKRIASLRNTQRSMNSTHKDYKVIVRDVSIVDVLLYSWCGHCAELLGWYNCWCNHYSVNVRDQEAVSRNKPMMSNILASLGFEATYIANNNNSNNDTDNDMEDGDNENQTDITLADVLRDELGFRRFMSYLFSEFSYENLLCLIEVQQFVRLCQYEETHNLPDAISIISLSEDRQIEPTEDDVKNLPPALDLTSKLMELAPSVNEIKSSIVSYESMNKEQKFLVLYQKYIADDSEMPVNISFRVRQDLREVANFLLRATLPSRMVTKDVFDGLISELIYLMRDSLSRFKYTPDFMEVKRSILQHLYRNG